ncbi:MAG: protein translocase subunit SecD [Eubacteriales bacterium]|nr:protein translocase subunit SecD [Eubacteriales bacterium]
MNVRKIVALVIIIVLTAAAGIVAFGGAAWGIYKIDPLFRQIPQGLDLTGGVSVVYEAADLTDPYLAQNIDIAFSVMRTRLDSEGYTEATISRQGTGRLRIEIPINESNMVDDPSAITQYLVKPAVVQFLHPDGTVLFEGSNMTETGVTMNPTGGSDYVVNFTLDAEATQAFAKATGELVGTGKSIDIKLDDTVISNPTVNSVISGGSAYIEGGFTYEEAARLTQQIQSGAIPIEMEEIEVRSVSATLGDEAMETSLLAAIIGIGLILVFMAVYYRLPGLMADLALVIYMIIVLFCLATIPGVQLTLPGIAGIILSIGMAVDANVVIFERMREELRSGKSPRTSVKAGFSRAFTAIMDSNVTTVIAALVLLFFGTGTIKGFAVTLLIGIIVSFITAVFITRGLMNLLLGFNIKNKALFCPMKTQSKEAE